MKQSIHTSFNLYDTQTNEFVISTLWIFKSGRTCQLIETRKKEVIEINFDTVKQAFDYLETYYILENFV